MKQIILTFLCLSILSCNKEAIDIEPFLSNNYNYFTYKVKERYPNYKYKMLENSSGIDNLKLKTIDSLYENVILGLDNNFHINKNSKNLLQKYKNIKIELSKVVDNNQNYILVNSINYEKYLKTENGIYIIKTEILSSFDRAIDYLNYQKGISCNFHSDTLNIDYTIKNDSIKEIVFSDFFVQKNYGKTEVFIEKITKQEKNIKKNIKGEFNNFSFFSLNVNNLKKGNYKIKGKIRYYEKYGDLIDLPFDREFKVN